ncbi:MAG TPA: hypothetical protein VK141_02510 [Nitrosomonas sp.]|nr:hypothetical protein [Nitrosomonas sp.]
MATQTEIEAFLESFHAKMRVYQIVFRDDRSKNTQALADLEIVGRERIKIIESLQSIDYCEGPIAETLYQGAEMWVFGKEVKGNDVYIKISMGKPGLSVICISFHIAEQPLTYPLKAN